jgi:heat shock protein HtpX
MSNSLHASSRVLVREKIPGSAVDGMVEFLENYYLTPALHASRIDSYSKRGSGAEGNFELSWQTGPTAPGLPRPEQFSISVRLTIGLDGVAIVFRGMDPVTTQDEEALRRIGDEVEVVATTFLARAKRTSLYFVFSLGGEKSMEAPEAARGSMNREVRRRIFAGNTVNLFLAMMLLNFVLIIFLGSYAIIAIVGVQALLLFYSDRLVLGSGNVRPDKDRPEVAVVRVTSTPEVKEILAKTGEALLSPIRGELGRAISERTVLAPETKSKIHDIMVRDRVPCSLDDIEITVRSPYHIVQAAAEKFHLPVPKISILNTPLDNAAATGISYGRSSISITAGALEDLDDDQLTSVIGHELGHVKGRDPLILFFATMAIYFGGPYLWAPLVLRLGFFYYFVAFGLVYTVGKFLETRADTLSMVVLGNPSVLASALTNIGFRQLYFERYSRPYRIVDWLRFDPHPPIYFRVGRLSRFASKGGQVRHALLVSIRDCFAGFFAALIGMG